MTNQVIDANSTTIIKNIDPSLSEISTYNMGGVTSDFVDTNSITTNTINIEYSNLSSITATSISMGSTFINGSYLNPIRIGNRRLWLDTIYDVLRTKTGSDPNGERDGNILEEGSD